MAELRTFRQPIPGAKYLPIGSLVYRYPAEAGDPPVAQCNQAAEVRTIHLKLPY